jgi:hypothetical protein
VLWQANEMEAALIERMRIREVLPNRNQVSLQETATAIIH